MTAHGNEPDDGAATSERCEHDYRMMLRSLVDAPAGVPAAMEIVYRCRMCDKVLTQSEYLQELERK
jgi:hypothetical protein